MASDAGAAQPRSVFNSDDDLTSFLAGLRAKYASLYPQYTEGQLGGGVPGATDSSTGDTDPNRTAASDVAPILAEGAQPTASAVAAAAVAVVDKALAGTSLAFDHKLSQLRSSLQSMHQLLPPRTSTTANLLDSFTAVSATQAAAAALLPAVASVPPAVPDAAAWASSSNGGADGAGGGGLARDGESVPLLDAESAHGPSAPSADAGPVSADDNVSVMAVGWGYGRTAAEAAAPLGLNSAEPSFAVSVSVCTDVDADTDAAFVELAAGYSLHALQAPSSEGSDASVMQGYSAEASRQHPPQPLEPAPLPSLSISPGNVSGPDHYLQHEREERPLPGDVYSGPPPVRPFGGVWGTQPHQQTLRQPPQQHMHHWQGNGASLAPPIAASFERGLLYASEQETSGPPTYVQEEREGEPTLQAASLQGGGGCAEEWVAEGPHPGDAVVTGVGAALGGARTVLSPGRRRAWQLVGHGGGPVCADMTSAGGVAAAAPAPAAQRESHGWPLPLECGLARQSAGQHRSYGGGSSSVSTGGGGTGPDATRESSAAWESEETVGEDKEEGGGGTSGEEAGMGAGAAGEGGLEGAEEEMSLWAARYGRGEEQQPHHGHIRHHPQGEGEQVHIEQAQLWPQRELAEAEDYPGVARRSAEASSDDHQQAGSSPGGGVVVGGVGGGQHRQRRRWGSPLQDPRHSHHHQHPVAVAVVPESADSHKADSESGTAPHAPGWLQEGSPLGPGCHPGRVAARTWDEGSGVRLSGSGGGDSRHRSASPNGRWNRVAAPAVAVAVAGKEGEYLLEPDGPPPARPGSGYEPTVAAAVTSEPEPLLGASPYQLAHQGLEEAQVREPERSVGDDSSEGHQQQPQRRTHAQPQAYRPRVSMGSAQRSLRLLPPPPASATPTGPAEGEQVDTEEEAASPPHDDVLCGSPTAELPALQRPHPSEKGDPPPMLAAAAVEIDGDGGASTSEGGVAAGDAARVITANRGGVAFTISAQTQAGAAEMGTSADPADSRGPGRSPPPLRGSGGVRASPGRPPDPPPQPAQPSAPAAAPRLHPTAYSVAHTHTAAGGTSEATPLDWDLLNRHLRDAGFGSLVMAPASAAIPAAVPHTHSAVSAWGGGPLAPEAPSLHRCLGSVLEQYVRRNRLVTELLAATEQSGRVAEQQEAALRDLQREANAAKAAAEKARRELADVSSHQMPKVEARHAAQLAKVRSEAAKLKESLRDAELEAVAKAEEIRSLRATVTGLQSASGHSADVEAVGLRQRLAQLEVLLRARDKEVEKLKVTKEATVGQAEDGQANALDRAYEAEGAARRLDLELSAARARVGQLEQALAKRERDVSTMRDDLAAIKACEAAASLAAGQRAGAAEEAARRAEGEAAGLRGKVKELEGMLRAAKQDIDKQRSDAEALRSSAYEEIYRLEDECRSLGAELGAAKGRAGQLEHVVRAKERDVARARDEKEASKAAERERARVAEDVSVKLETELTAAKVRLAQAEGSLRSRERELARLAELLRQTQGAEVEAWLKHAKTEEGGKKLESDFTSLRLRVLQLETALKARDKECDKLGRTVETLRGEAHELTSKLAKGEEAARKVDAELAAARGKALNLEGLVRVKEREQERLVRVVEGLKAGEAEVAGRQAALDEAARRLDGRLGAARGRAAALEGVVRARDAAVERLNRQLEALKTAEFERTAQASKSEEAVRQQEAESTALRQRVVQLEGQLRTKEREMERTARQAEAGRAAEADTARRLADAATAAARLEAEVAAGRTRATQLGEALRGREREVATLSRALDAQRSAEHEACVAVGRTEEVAKKLDGEAAELRQRLTQAEGHLRAREREAERVARALEAAQTASAEAALKQAEAEAACRRLEADAAGLRQRLAQAEGAVRSRERELDRAEKLIEQAKGAESEAEARRRSAETAVSQADSELASLRGRIGGLEATAKGHTKEVERLTRVVDQSKAAEVDATARAHRSEVAAKQVAGELASARSRLTKLEASLAAREAESQRLQKLLVAAEAQAAAQVVRSDDFVRRVDADLATMRQRAVQLAGLLRGREKQLSTLRGGTEVAQAEQDRASAHLRTCEETIRRLEGELAAERQQAAAAAGQLRGRDKQLATLRGGMEALQAEQDKAGGQLRKCEESLRKLEGELAAERQRAVQLEGQVKSRDKEVERLGRQLDAGRDQSSSMATVAGREAAGLKDVASKAEAALATARARITQLEAEMLSKERQLDGMQRLAGYSRAGDAEAAAVAAERAGRAEDAAKRLDVELGGLRQKYAQLEHTFRSREATMDKLRAALAEKVAREERRLARDKAAYGRIRTAYLSTGGNGGGGGAGAGGGTPSGKAAGAMAAAARELRPVEIVGLYEARREATEEELAACKAEVRSLAEQLRDAQNLIAMKDRSGAWRTPQELADMQARVITLERRCADLQREVDRSRADAAEAGRTAERRLAEVDRRAVQLKEDNEALVHELDSRPTLQENRALKREVEIMEKRLLQVKGSAATNGAGAEAEGGETALGLAVAGKGRGAGGGLMSTAQRMARDRSVHKLGLRGLEDWPKDVMVDLLQDVCIELELSDATTLPAAVRKALRVVGAVPRMEAFIGAVCEAVYKRGGAFVPPHIDGTTDPSRVLEVLGVWLGLLQEGAQLRGVMRSVTEALSSRAEGMAMPIHGPGDLLTSVRQLVEAEAVALTARESLAAASHHMAAQPEALLSRLVSHFMRLFDCPFLEGVVPCVNRLYVSLNEQRNFCRALAAAVGLPADAGASACMSRVRELLGAASATGSTDSAARQRGGAGAGGGNGEQLLPDYVKGRHGAAASPAAPSPPQQSQPSGGVGVEVSAALERLMGLFAVRTAAAAAEAADRAVERLRRLDAVLPRYQKLASQLFEALRCTSLEEVIPALRAALQGQHP